MRHGAAATITLLALLGTTAAAVAQLPGDPVAGRRLAEAWCSDCHLVAPGGPGRASDAVPGFAAIARMPSTTEMSLRAFLRTPHPPMPDLQLSREQTDDLVSHILGLR